MLTALSILEALRPVPIVFVVHSCAASALLLVFAAVGVLDLVPRLDPLFTQRALRTPVVWLVASLGLINVCSAATAMAAVPGWLGAGAVFRALLLALLYAVVSLCDTLRSRPRSAILWTCGALALLSGTRVALTFLEHHDVGAAVVLRLLGFLVTRAAAERTIQVQLMFLMLPVVRAVYQDRMQLRFFVTSESVLVRMASIYLSERRRAPHSPNGATPAPERKYSLYTVGMAKAAARQARLHRSACTSGPAAPQPRQESDSSITCSIPDAPAPPNATDPGQEPPRTEHRALHAGICRRVRVLDALMTLLAVPYIVNYCTAHFGDGALLPSTASWALAAAIFLLSCSTLLGNISMVVMSRLLASVDVWIIVVNSTLGMAVAFAFEVGQPPFAADHAQFVAAFWCTISYFLLQDALRVQPFATQIIVGLLFLFVNLANVVRDVLVEHETPTIVAILGATITVRDFNRGMRTSVFLLSIRSVS